MRHDLTHLPAARMAGGSQASKRKRGSPNHVNGKSFAAALTSFLETCMNTGKSDLEVGNTILKELPGQPNSGRTRGPQTRVLADPPMPDYLPRVKGKFQICLPGFGP